MSSETISIAPRERVLAYGGEWNSRERGADGAVTVVQHVGKTGDSIVVDPVEEQRLEAIGALAPIGATAADVEREAQARIDQYAAGRRTLPDYG